MKMTAVLLLLVLTVSATMEKTFSQDKRAVKLKGDVLSKFSCRYLKVKGYLTSSAKLKNLCAKTYHCNDILSKQSCSVLKTRNECSKNSKLSQVYCPFTCNKCGGVPVCKTSIPLGMQSKAIRDSQITASTFHYHKDHSPSHARLHMNINGWLPKKARVGDWLQVDLGSRVVVTGIATQGRRSSSYAEWTKSYTLKYSNDGKVFHKYLSGKVFQGNSDKNTVVKNTISPPIYARYIRVYVKTFNSHPAIRMELYGCK